jgi:hypothetical protein
MAIKVFLVPLCCRIRKNLQQFSGILLSRSAKSGRSIFHWHTQRNILIMDFLPFALRDLLFPENIRERTMAACCYAEAIHRTVLIADQAGLIGLFVDAKNERAHKFYEKYGFFSLPGHAQQLFLPLETLRLSVFN